MIPSTINSNEIQDSHRYPYGVSRQDYIRTVGKLKQELFCEAFRLEKQNRTFQKLLLAELDREPNINIAFSELPTPTSHNRRKAIDAVFNLLNKKQSFAGE